jgi:signal transduction histidine kinase/CheY-like chemotaxis protein
MRLSNRLLLVIATCLLPVIALQAAVAWSQWSERKAQLNGLALHQTELLGADVASIAEGARILLKTTAEFWQVRALDSQCSARLASIRQNVPSYSFLALVDARGEIRCSSDEALAASVRGASWIDDAQDARAFTAGHYARSPHYPGGFLPFFLPVRTDGSGGNATLVAALDLTWLSQHLLHLKQSGSNFLSGGVLTVADADGVILARNPHPAEFVGRQFPPAAMPIVHAEHPGLMRLKSIDGTDRVIGYIPPTPASDNLSTVVGFYEPDLMGDINHALIRSAIMLGLATVVAILLTLVIARRFIARPTGSLLLAARRWQEGDLSARAPGCERHSEFGQIASAWNEMAAALARREEELQGHAEALEARVAERTQELLVTNNRLQIEIAEREKTEAALVQSQKLQAVGQLAGGIAHDFNNLLTTIQGSLDLLARGVPPQNEKQRAWIERASGAVLRGTQLTGRLLAFSRRRPLAVRTTDINRIVTDLVALLSAATLGHRIRVETQLAADVWPAVAEPSQMEAALLNLALNARDAMPEGGLLRLETANRTIETAESDLAAGEYVAVTVTDTGTGMTEEVARRALEAFFTTKGLSGSGLGLSQVQAMVQECGGALQLNTAPGQGTSITLLLARGQSGSAVDRPRERGVRRHSGQTALVVDDDEAVLDITVDMLRQLGYSASRATNGNEALQWLEKNEEPPALVIVDYAMPGMNGMNLTIMMRERGFTGIVVLATGYADLSEVPKEHLKEMRAVLNKPYTFQDLEHLLNQIEDGNIARTALSVMEAAR